MITSPDNHQLKLIRKLQRKKERDETGLFVAEGEDLVRAAEAAGWEPELLLRAGEDVEPDLLARATSLGSGSRVAGVYRRRWADPGGELSVYLHGVGDPGNIGTIVRAAHAFCDGAVVLGPGCADPWSPKAVRASMGSIFARPCGRAAFAELPGARLALDAGAAMTLAEGAAGASAPLLLCVGAEREGLPDELLEGADAAVSIPLRSDGPGSLNAAMAAAIALYEIASRMAADA